MIQNQAIQIIAKSLKKTELQVHDKMVLVYSLNLPYGLYLYYQPAYMVDENHPKYIEGNCYFGGNYIVDCEHKLYFEPGTFLDPEGAIEEYTNNRKNLLFRIGVKISNFLENR